jgi:hypothetical protein
MKFGASPQKVSPLIVSYAGKNQLVIYFNILGFAWATSSR